MTTRERTIAAALIHLAAARDLLKAAKAPAATAKVRAAITSAQNATPAPLRAQAQPR